MGFSLKVRNFRGLRKIDWSPSGVCAVVGPNGSGKTTLLDIPALLRDALESGFARAIERHGGVPNARNVYAPENEPYDFEVRIDSTRWRMAPLQVGSGFRPEEEVRHGDTNVVQRAAGADLAQIQGVDVPVRDVLALAVLRNELAHTSEQSAVADGVLTLVSRLQRYRLHANYDLKALRRSGSPDSSERRLATDGANVFSVLRNWRDRRDDRPRYERVFEGLREMFGDFFEELDFVKAAQVVGTDLRLRGDKVISANLAPDGWFVALLHLTAVASTDPGDIIAIDEPENALHPHAIKCLLEWMREWSRRHQTTILLATHSPVILDGFREQPERLYVMEPKEELLPIALSELKDRDWLAHFSFGDLYAREEFGAPVDGDANRPDHDR